MQRVDHAVGIDVEVEGVIRVGRVVRMALLRFIPADDLAGVFDQGLALGNINECKHAAAVHAGAADLKAADRGKSRLGRHVLKIWYRESVRVRVRPQMCARVRTRDKGL